MRFISFQKIIKYQKNYEIIWAGESEIFLPNGQKLKFKKVKGRGINLKFLKQSKIK